MGFEIGKIEVKNFFWILRVRRFEEVCPQAPRIGADWTNLVLTRRNPNPKQNRGVQCRHDYLQLPGPFIGFGSLAPQRDAALQ